MPDRRTVSSVAAMHELAGDVLAQLESGAVLLLEGELGAGKTTFTQGIARALGIVDDVTSPTFTIVGEYDVPSHPVFKRLIHVDLYRLAGDSAAHESAIQEVLENAGDDGSLTVIEWPERLGDAVPKNARRIRFEHGATAGERIVVLSG